MSEDQPCKQNRSQPSLPGHGIGALYVHVPFCLRKCHYCDFYSLRAHPDPMQRYVQSALGELALKAPRLVAPLASVFVGGGTPTVLGGQLLAKLLSALGPLVGSDTEFTVEANPGTLDETVVAVLVSSGVNRVSLGVQSFNEDELQSLGRVHSAHQARQAVMSLREAGIDNINLDLIYGIPGQTPQSWNATLGEALELQPEHLSCYALSIEPGTPLERQVQAGKQHEMDETLQKQCYCAAIAASRRAGLRHYEISNFAQPPRQCRHNLTYWHNLPYLGIGPAAVSYVDGARAKTLLDLERYIQVDRSGRVFPADEERITGRALLAETMMLELRLVQGIDRAAFKARFGVDAVEAFSAPLRRYELQGALVVSPSHIRLDPSVLFCADTILADIIAEA